jgi:hypothetical protein
VLVYEVVLSLIEGGTTGRVGVGSEREFKGFGGQSGKMEAFMEEAVYTPRIHLK